MSDPLHRARSILASCRPACQTRPAGQSYRACLSKCARDARKPAAPPSAGTCPPPSALHRLLASGVTPEAVPVGRKGRCALTGPEGVLATYASCDNARQAIRRALCALPQAGGALCGTDAERRRTEVITPQGRDKAHYAVMDASQLVASHDPHTFSPDPRYPAGVQEREYRTDVNEMDKVRRGAEHMDPDIILHRAPTPADGPSLVTEDGCVLGGNGRAMMLKRAYDTGQMGAERYRETLACRAPEFGLTAQEVRSVPAPVLVRIVEGTRCDSDKKLLARKIRQFNEALTNALDVVALGVSQSRQLSPSTVAMFGELLAGGERSLREVMADEPRMFLRALESDGIVTASNRTKYATPQGTLTEAAKGEIEAMFLGRALGTSERIRSAPPDVLRKVERIVPLLAAVDARNPSFSQTETVNAAIDLVSEAKNRGQPLEFVLQQAGMESVLGGGVKRDPHVVALARVLSTEGPNAVRERFRGWARMADFDPSQSMLGMRPPTREDALRALVGGAKIGRDRPLFGGAVVQMPSDNPKAPYLARVVGVYDGKSKEDGGSGVKKGRVRIEFMTGPQRGRRVEVEIGEVGDVAA